MSKISEFNEHFQKTLTLRNELVPIGKTLENIISSDLLENDEKRSSDYKRAKEIIDDFHKDFIEKSLKSVNIDWCELEELLSKKNPLDFSEKKAFLKKVEKVQENLRKEIVNVFKNFSFGSFLKKKASKTNQKDEYVDLGFKDLFLSGLFKFLLPKSIKSEEDKKIISSFNNFTSYFTGFHENRKNIYTSDPIPTAVAYRIVNENFPKFLSNKKIFSILKKEAPQILDGTYSKLKEHGITDVNLEKTFELSNYNNCLNQSGIDTYNNVVGQINYAINLECQQNKSLFTLLKKNRSIKMTVLFKQILSDKDKSFCLDEYANDEEAINDVVHLYKKMVAEGQPQRIIAKLLQKIESYDTDKIYVKGKYLNLLSKSLFGGENWSLFREYVKKDRENDNHLKKNRKTSSEELDKALSKDDFSISYLSKISSVDLSEKISLFIKNQEKQLVEINLSDWPKSLKSNEDKNKIKTPLDLLLNFYRIAQMFSSNEVDKDMSFYAVFDEAVSSMDSVVHLYNKVRNYATRKPYSQEKIKLNFDEATLATGWTETKEKDYLTVIFLKDDKYYLGILNKNNKPNLLESTSSCSSNASNDCYMKMRYFLFDIKKQLSRCVFTKEVKEHFKNSTENYPLFNEDTFISQLNITKDIYDLACAGDEKKKKGEVKKYQKKYETVNKEEYRKSLSKWISFGLNFLSSYKTTSKFDLSELKKADEYDDVKQFYDDVNNLTYKIEFVNLKASYVDSLVNNGQLYLFEIRNKDFAMQSRGKPNLHTLYFKSIFDELNIRKGIVKLNGNAEIFYRKKSLSSETTTVHSAGSFIVNKVYINPKTGKSEQLPDVVYNNIYNYVNGKTKELSPDAKEYYSIVTVKQATHDIVKDKRYTVDKFFFHCPITINYRYSAKPSLFDDKVLSFLRKNENINIIGIDRGERNLIYATVINQKGEILASRSFNTIKHQSSSKTFEVDYHDKLQVREKNRIEERRSWNSISKIADLKEGYLSSVIHEIALMMIKYNAIVVMENLNQGFKRVREGIAERSVYQRFEKMLIDKLNYFVIKTENWTNPGGVLNGYQLTNKVSTIKDIGNQCGFLFYVPAAYTSKIDPSTGFVNLFNLGKYKNPSDQKNLICKFKKICFIKEDNLFEFSIDYKKLCPDREVSITKWDVFSYGKRVLRVKGNSGYSGYMEEVHDYDPTEELKSLFSSNGIDYINNKNLLETLSSSDLSGEFWNKLFQIFKAVLQMRNSQTNSSVDRLLSPVKGKNGRFFDTDKVEGTEFEKLKDADANGAYNIALKGLLILKKNDSVKTDKDLKNVKSIPLKDWLNFVQVTMRG